MLKRRVWSWKIALGVAAIAIGAFVFFDVLDVDGSQLRAQAAESILTETDSTETGRLCTAQPTPHVLGPSLLSPSPSAAPDPLRPGSLVCRTHAPGSTTLARARLTLASASGSGSAADPV